MTTDWTAAGKKAWETRRTNILKQKRSDAAKKAWVTIRQNKSQKESHEQ